MTNQRRLAMIIHVNYSYFLSLYLEKGYKCPFQNFECRQGESPRKTYDVSLGLRVDLVSFMGLHLKF